MQPEWSFCRECGYSPGAAAEPSAPVDEAAAQPALPDEPVVDPEPVSPGPLITDPYDLSPPPADADDDAGAGMAAAAGFVGLGGGADPAAPSSGFDPFDAFTAPAPNTFEAPPPASFDAPAPTSFDAANAFTTPAPWAAPAADREAPAGDDLPSSEPEAGADLSAPAADSFDGPPPYDPDAPFGVPVEPASFDGPPPYDPDAPFGVPVEPASFDGPPPYDPDAPFGVPAAGSGTGPADWASPSVMPDTFEAPTPSSGGGSPGLPAPDFGGGPPRVAIGSGPPTGSSPFKVNRVVAVAAIVVGAIVLIGGIVFLTGGSSNNVATSGSGGTTPPPLGALTTGVPTPTTVGPNTPVIPNAPTTAKTGGPPCDSQAAVISPDGQNYTPCGGGFSVDLPGLPDTRTFDADLPTGKVKWTLLISTDQDYENPVRYYVAWGDLPAPPSPEEADAAMASLVKSVEGTLGGPTTFQDQPARTISGTTDQGVTLTGIVFVRGTKVYAMKTATFGSGAKELERLTSTFEPL